MNESWKALAVAALCAVVLSSCGGCASQSATPRRAVDAGAGESHRSGNNGAGSRPREGEVLPVDERIELSDGVEDVKNQFAFAVMVKATVKAGGTLKCTGVLVSPRWVLTAGHCVCPLRKSTELGSEAAFVIDRSACAEEVAVTIITYDPRPEDPAAPTGFQAENHRGKVKVHPHLRVLLDERSLVLSSNADLALALLDEPVEDAALPVRLADSEAKVGEVFLIAGYGFDSTTDLIHGVRRFGEKEVKGFLANGSDEVLFAPHGGAFSSGSGEPCLRREKAGMALVGLSSKGFGSMPAFTSLHVHREWLDAEMQSARTSNDGVDDDLK